MDNPSKEATPGDILYAANNKNIRGVKPHFIIYLGPNPDDEDLFFGAMLTTSPFFSNIPLEAGHFEKLDPDGHPWRVIYAGSFISADLYHKKIEWKPFTKVGQLSALGLVFVQSQIGGSVPKFSPLNK